MLRKQLLWVYFLIILLLLAAAIYFPSFVFPSIISPIAQFLWAIYRIFASVHQKIYWFLLIGLVVLLTYRVIFSIPSETPDSSRTELNKPTGREQFWLKAISSAIKQGKDSQDFIRGQLGQLFLSASNLSALTKTENLEKSLVDLQILLPTNLQSLFMDHHNENKKTSRRAAVAFPQYVFEKTWWGKKRAAQARYKEIDAILKSMESYLEIDHENETK